MILKQQATFRFISTTRQVQILLIFWECFVQIKQYSQEQNKQVFRATEMDWWAGLCMWFSHKVSFRCVKSRFLKPNAVRVPRTWLLLQDTMHTKIVFVPVELILQKTRVNYVLLERQHMTIQQQCRHQIAFCVRLDTIHMITAAKNVTLAL